MLLSLALYQEARMITERTGTKNINSRSLSFKLSEILQCTHATIFEKHAYSEPIATISDVNSFSLKPVKLNGSIAAQIRRAILSQTHLFQVKCKSSEHT